MARPSHTVPRLATRLAELLRGEAGAGLLLIAIALVALAAANSPWAGPFHDLFNQRLAWTPVAHLYSLHAWINDGLMALFFFLVGLEIKREIIAGELKHPAQRRLPVLAAIAGMVVPAAVYMLITASAAELHRGWAVPAATDIAFALGVIALIGNKAPPSLRLFLLTVAIVDDLGAVAIIALAYTAEINTTYLAISAAVLTALALCNRLGVTRGWIYALGGLALWYAVLHSGVHATVAGVLAALTVPMTLDARGDSLLLRMEHALAPISAYLILPIFGLANAGVAIPAALPSGAALLLPLGVGLGLLIGKLAGIFAAVWLAEKTGFAQRPPGASWPQVFGLAALCGIGFTMSLFIAQLAFPGDPALVDDAKLGVLGGSLLAGVLGYTVLRRTAR